MKLNLHLRGFLPCAILLLCLGMTAAPRAEETPPDEAHALIDRVQESIRNARTMSVTAVSVMKMDMQGMKMEMEMTEALVMKQPNRMRLATEGKGMMATMGSTMVCDGENVYQVMPMMKRYTKSPAPKDMKDLMGPGAMVGGMNMGFMMLSSLLMEDMEDTGSALPAKLVGREEIDGKTLLHIRSGQEMMPVDYWITEGDHPRLVKVVPDFSAAMGEAAKMNDRRGGPAVDAEDTKMDVEITFRDWEFDKEIADSEFAFTAPEGYELGEDMFGDVREIGGMNDDVHPLVGQPAPALKLPLLGGGELDLAAHQGKDIVILDFWATWCGPCVRAMPKLIKVAGEYADKHVVFYGVNLQESDSKIGKFLESKDFKLNVALDRDGTAGALYRAESIPQTVIVGMDGTVQVVHVGFSPSLDDELRADLDALLAGKNLSASGAAR